MSKARLLVTIDDRETNRLPMHVECDSLVALMETNGQAMFSARGLSPSRLALHTATLLTRLHELDPTALVTALLLISKGSVAEAGPIRDPGTGEISRPVPRDRKALGREVIATLRTALELDA